MASHQVSGSADEVHYWCGQIDGNPGACDNWWGWLRYGQYLALVDGVEVPSANTEIPSWLRAAVEDVDRTLPARAPRNS